MNNQNQACFTFDAACDAAIEMESRIYQKLLLAIRVVKNPAANDILRETAAERLSIKQKLELAALEGDLDEQEIKGAVPIMNLAESIHCCDLHHISAEADNRKALAYAIKLSKDALEFYRSMAERCSGAPMAKLFKSLGDEQTHHLQQLEDTYEEHFLTEG